MGTADSYRFRVRFRRAKTKQTEFPKVAKNLALSKK